MLTLTGITKSFKDKIVVRDVDLHIGENQIYGLVGSNGAGKTTVMKLISGLLREDSGTIEMFGKSGGGLVSARKSLGVLIESPAVNPDVSAYENLEYYFYIFGKKPSKSVINDYLELVSLHNIDKKKTGEFSLGMKQRLGIAIALINDAKLLLLDEPTNGLDPIGIIEIRKLILDIVKTKNISVLISSHILSELEQLADSFGFLHEGKIMAEISSEEMYSNLNRLLSIKIRNEREFRKVAYEMQISDYVDYNAESEFFSIPMNVLDVNEFLQRLIHHNIDVLDMDISKTSLEDYYISVIGGKR